MVSAPWRISGGAHALGFGDAAILPETTGASVSKSSRLRSGARVDREFLRWRYLDAVNPSVPRSENDLSPVQGIGRYRGLPRNPRPNSQMYIGSCMARAYLIARIRCKADQAFRTAGSHIFEMNDLYPAGGSGSAVFGSARLPTGSSARVDRERLDLV